MNMPAKATRICAALVALSACAPSVGASRQEGQLAAAQEDEASQVRGTTSDEAGTTGTDSSVLPSTSERMDDGDEPRAATKGSDKARVKGPRPADIPFDLPVPVASELTPVCAERGDEISLNVETKPGGAVAYQAVYSDNGGGAAVPFGEGYGGNDKGTADEDGGYESSWVVGLNAPAGPARLDIVVGHKGKFGYDDPHFAVADENGNCPEAWLAEEHDD